MNAIVFFGCIVAAFSLVVVLYIRNTGFNWNISGDGLFFRALGAFFKAVETRNLVIYGTRCVF